MATDAEQATTFEDQQQTELADYDEDDQFDQDQEETQQTESNQNDSAHPKLRIFASTQSTQHNA